MRFISLIKFKGKPTKEKIAENINCIERATKSGVKIISIDWTLGRYDSVVIMEAPNEKIALKWSLKHGGCMATETLVAIPAKEARKFVK